MCRKAVYQPYKSTDVLRMCVLFNSQHLQIALYDALYAWSDLWQLPLSLQKCIILHLGSNNTLHNYSVNNVSLPDVTVVTDLGVLVENNLRFTKHYRSIVNKANHRSSLILK